MYDAFSCRHTSVFTATSLLLCTPLFFGSSPRLTLMGALPVLPLTSEYETRSTAHTQFKYFTPSSRPPATSIELKLPPLTRLQPLASFASFGLVRVAVWLCLAICFAPSSCSSLYFANASSWRIQVLATRSLPSRLCIMSLFIRSRDSSRCVATVHAVMALSRPGYPRVGPCLSTSAM